METANSNGTTSYSTTSYGVDSPRTDVLKAARAVEDLLNAESQLARRRSSQSGPNDTDRAAMRLIIERAAVHDPVTPKELAEHLQMSSASVSTLLHRLAQGGSAHAIDHPDDGRRKLIVPSRSLADSAEVDPVAARIRAIAQDLSPQEAELVTGFLGRVTEAINRPYP
ncbi:MarR family winged helix-turn-helix transcriptional regulator [Naasia lichenicola]|uniref:MarR family transcriptional regulator n=1 Tax=Naasia lichenicola TaxID=2565933 RepID=A0A4S4FJC8_9MICO|nr:MarR family transcriptional regulator [Naasia lichenicola]THG30014.1 MarR family transcriptional regulator [Naasia lichenicola]